MSIGEKIKKKRKEKNLSQKELAEKTSIKQSQISAIESEKCKASAETLKEICKALQTDPREILEIEYTKTEIQEIYDKLNEENQEEVIDYAKMRLEKQNKPSEAETSKMA